MKLCEYINQCLNAIGVEKVFGIPGSLVMPVWQSITDAEVILCGHEQEASYVAAGYGKMSRKPVAVITTGGPGVTNCISGIASAYMDSVPVIYISGRTPLDKNGKGLRQEESHYNRMFDSVDVLKNFTKQSICVDNIKTAARDIWECMCSAVKERRGSVHISVPLELQSAEVPDTEALDMEVLNAGAAHHRPKLYKGEKALPVPDTDRPVIIMGWGCWMADAADTIYKIAEKLSAPVLVTSKAYCCIRYENPCYLGKLGYGYTSCMDEFFQIYKPDAVLAFGTSLGEKDIPVSLQGYIEGMDVYLYTNDKSACEHKAIHPDYIWEGDLKEACESLYWQMPALPENRFSLQLVQMVKERTEKYWRSRIEGKDLMAQVIESFNGYGGGKLVITADAGNHLADAGALIDKISEGGFFLDVGIRAMGSGICAAVGMAIAAPDKTYLAITGDGCMLMNGNVMHLAKERELPVVFLVFNNHALGRVRVGQSRMNDYRATSIDNVDFQMYGRAFGLDTYRYTSFAEFDAHIQEIISAGKTALVEMVTDRDEIPVAVKDHIY